MGALSGHCVDVVVCLWLWLTILKSLCLWIFLNLQILSSSHLCVDFIYEMMKIIPIIHATGTTGVRREGVAFKGGCRNNIIVYTLILLT